MATNDDDVFRPTDEASIALLRGLRANTVNLSFIHRADVCSAAPEDLVADLQPVLGTDTTEDGYNRMWYIYCPKRYKNARGEPRGHRHRAVAPDRKMSWHSEGGAKPLKGVPGATICDLSYGYKEKEEASGKQRFERVGWSMAEFDDTLGGGGDHVLCRVRRASSSLAKSKFKSSSSSKRKAAGDHPDEAPPAKQICHEQVQVQVQQDPAAFFNDAYPAMPCYAYPTTPCYGYGPPHGVDPVTMVGGEEERGVQLPRVELEAEHVDGGESFNVEELLNTDEFTNAVAYTTIPAGYGGHGGSQVMDAAMFGDVEPEHGGEFNVEELLNTEEFTNADAYPTVPACYGGHGGSQVMDAAMFGDVEPEPERGGDLGEFNIKDLLKTDEWKGFEDFLAQVAADDEPAEQGGGIVASGGLLYAC